MTAECSTGRCVTQRRCVCHEGGVLTLTLICLHAGARVQISYGVDVAVMPPNSYVHTAPLSSMSSKSQDGQYVYLGVAPAGDQGGHVVVFSDSNCLDSSHQMSPCYEFLGKILDRVLLVSQSE